LLPNLNRWEGQLGLPPTPAAEAERKARVIEVETHPAHRVDLTGTDVKTNVPTRMLAVVLPEGDKAFSFMLKGPPEKVAAHEAAFDQFVASIRFPGHNHGGSSAAADPHNHEAQAGASTQPADDQGYALTNFKAPPGWEQDTTEKQFRIATFYAGAGNDRAEVIVSKFGLSRFGSMLDNVNRWRGEVGLPPTDDENKENVQAAQVAGANTLLFEFPGADRRSYVAMLVKGRDVWFVKMIGPAKPVADQRPNFEAFLQSLQFGVAAGE
jgi:hypothetical protein